MADEQGLENSAGSQSQPNTTPKSVDLNVGGNVGGNIVVGDNNYVVNNYYPVVEKNVEKHEPDFWALKHPYPMPPNFTGRIAERATLTYWLKEDSENRLFILRALGGFGKSALSWQWLTHDVDIKEYPKVLWWSFYEGDASFEHFIEEALKYLKLEVPQGGRPQVDELLKAMQGQKILLIMDGFERALRAYSSMNAAYQGDEKLPPSPLVGEGGRGEGEADCVNINAEIFLKSVCSLPNIKSKVLMTTRLTPRAVKPRGEFMLGCREEKLTAMQKEDAVEFFHKQKIKGTHTEIEAACAPYGYHPLSLRLLAGRILKDFENPADIVVAQKLKINGDIIQQKHHVLEVSYNSLPPHEQKLLSTIACFRSPVELNTLQSIAENKDTLDDDLHDLVDRGLLHHTTRLVSNHPVSTFDLHPIVRRYAYNCLATANRTDTHEHLVNYFEAIPEPEKIEKLEDLTALIELYYHMVKAGMFEKAIRIYIDKLGIPFYFQFGVYHFAIDLLSILFLDGEYKIQQLENDDSKVYTLNELANIYSMIGQLHHATHLYDMANEIDEKRQDKEGLAVGLGSMASVALLPKGSLKLAENNFIRSIKLCQETEAEFEEATDYCRLGLLLAYRGVWEDSEKNLLRAQTYFEKLGSSKTSFCSVTWAYRSQRAYLMARMDHSKIANIKLAIDFANRALESAKEHSLRNKSYERDFIRAHWLLGVSYRLDSGLDLAELHLGEALLRDRAINLVREEADILLDLARLRYDQKNYEEAKSIAEEALSITERCGYVLQGADVNLFLATLALEGVALSPSKGHTLERFKFDGKRELSDKEVATLYAKEALKLATCDGPPYYYKVAYEEAERMLKELG